MKIFEYTSVDSKSQVRVELFTDYNYDGVEEGVIYTSFRVDDICIDSTYDYFNSVKKAKLTFRRMCIFLINKINL